VKGGGVEAEDGSRAFLHKCGEVMIMPHQRKEPERVPAA
jgi:hypothetical protein